MNVFGWVVFGLIAGLIAHSFDSEEVRGGIFGSILLGITGSLVGGFVANMLFGVNHFTFDLPSFIIAIAGSLLVLFVYHTAFTADRRI